jgi:membrane protein
MSESASMHDIKELQARYRDHWAVALVRNYLDDDADGLASALAFGAIFSLMPILIVTFLIITLLLQTQVIYNEALKLVAEDAPESVATIVEGILQSGEDNITGLGIMTLVTFLLGGSRLYTAMDRACAQVFRTERRSHVRRRLFSLVMMPLIPAVLLVATVVAGLATAALALPLDDLIDVDPTTTDAVLVYGVSYLLAFGMTALAYWKIPVEGPGFRFAAEGAAIAALLIVLLAQLFPLYVQITGGYSLYGSLFAFVLLLLLWLYLAGQIFVIGAEIAAYRCGRRSR